METKETRTVKVPAISCGHCVQTIQRELGELSGVQAVQADQNSKLVTVAWGDPASWQQIASLLEEIGYPAQA